MCVCVRVQLAVVLYSDFCSRCQRNTKTCAPHQPPLSFRSVSLDDSLIFCRFFFPLSAEPHRAAAHHGVYKLKHATPIILAQVDSNAANMVTATATATPETSSSTITLSTYIFVLLTILACMVGSVFSFICCKLMSSERKS